MNGETRKAFYGNKDYLIDDHEIIIEFILGSNM